MVIQNDLLGQNEPSVTSPSSRIKCDQYWPSRGTESYGVMSVTLTDTQELATYTVRTFQLQRVSAMNVSEDGPTQTDTQTQSIV